MHLGISGDFFLRFVTQDLKWEIRQRSDISLEFLMASPPRPSDSWDSAVLTGEDINACRERLRRMARRWMNPKLRRQIDSSDLIQETLLITLSKLSQLLGRSKREIFSWMVAVLRNRLLNHSKKIRHDSDETSEGILEKASDPFDFLASLLSTELRTVVDQELEKSNSLDRKIFELHYYEGMSFEMIAKEVNRTKPAVRSIHYRLLKSLRPRIEKHFQ